MSNLPDGVYDVIVVDAERIDEEVRIEVTITLGPHVGEIVVLRAPHVDQRRGPATREPHEILGLCGTLRVRHGIPTFRPESV
jgi:hypothetical protein